MNNYNSLKISEIVSQNLKAAEIFEDYDIDFCCGGDKTLNEACEEKDIPPEYIKKDLENVMNTNDSETVWINNLNLSELAEYIVKRHHSYIRENITPIRQYLEKICKVHGENHPELFTVKKEFFEASDALLDHLKEEEKSIFPVIDQLVQAKNESRYIYAPCFGIVSDPIKQMREDHLREGERFDELAEMTDNFTVPDDGCNTFKLTYERLKEFNSDLHKHIHLENNILFSKAVELEKEVVQCE